MSKLSILCYCGSGRTYTQCCAPLHLGQPAGNAEALMRSRYSAYVLGLDDYLLQSWHVSTRPPVLDLSEPTKWLGLHVLRHEPRDDTQALVEFVARYKVNGRAFRLHEVSRFVFEQGRWFYVDALDEAS
jgi:SEC-C motif-containing protein